MLGTVGKGRCVYLGLGHCHSRDGSPSPVDGGIDPDGTMPAEFNDVWKMEAWRLRWDQVRCELGVGATGWPEPCFLEAVMENDALPSWLGRPVRRSHCTGRWRQGGIPFESESRWLIARNDGERRYTRLASFQ